MNGKFLKLWGMMKRKIKCSYIFCLLPLFFFLGCSARFAEKETIYPMTKRLINIKSLNLGFFLPQNTILAEDNQNYLTEAWIVEKNYNFSIQIFNLNIDRKYSADDFNSFSDILQNINAVKKSNDKNLVTPFKVKNLMCYEYQQNDIAKINLNIIVVINESYYLITSNCNKDYNENDYRNCIYTLIGSFRINKSKGKNES